jgi:hypothetical protein
LDPKIIKVLWYLGLISAIAGLAIAAAGTVRDYSVGGLGFGDPLRGAIAVSIAAVIFGVYLLQFTANENLSNRIKELVHVDNSIKVEVPGFKGIKGIVGLLGMILTPLCALAMIVITFKDYHPPTTFNIGSVKTFLLFVSSLGGLVGLGLMVLYNQFLTTSLHQATKKLKELWKEQEKELEDLLEATAAKAAVVPPPPPAYYYQPQQSYYGQQQQAPAEPQPTVEAPTPEPLPPPPIRPKPKIKTPPPLPPPVVKMIPPPLPPALKPKEKTLPPPIEPVKEETKNPTLEELECPTCGEPIKAIWKFCPSCDTTFDNKSTRSQAKDPSEKKNALDDILSDSARRDNKTGKNPSSATTEKVPRSLGTCPKCGKTVKSQWKICPFCGKDFR